LEGPGPLAAASIIYSIQNGRQGLGSIFVWSAGNGAQNGDNCNADGYANWRYTIAIGALNILGVRASYSEPCSALFAVVPGGDVYQPDIDTTSVYIGQCETDFTGTSASAPLAAGIFALMLEANPLMSWLDLQYVLANSTIHIDPTDSSWQLNGAGKWVSTNYGFGLIDSELAVLNSLAWTGNIQEHTVDYTIVSSRAMFPTPIGYCASSTINVQENMRIHHVDVVLDVQHLRRGFLNITLISPSNTVSELMPTRPLDMNPDYLNWTFSSRMHWGEYSSGQWSLMLVDDSRYAPIDDGFLNLWQLVLHGREGSGVSQSFLIQDNSPSCEDNNLEYPSVSGGRTLITMAAVVSIASTICASLVFLFTHVFNTRIFGFSEGTVA